MELKNEVFERFTAIFRKNKKGNKLKKSELLKEQEDLLQEIEIQKEIIQHLKKALNDREEELEKERNKCYLEGVRRGRYVAGREELGILEELRILEQIEETLIKS